MLAGTEVADKIFSPGTIGKKFLCKNVDPPGGE
jgi:hypothetical protein